MGTQTENQARIASDKILLPNFWIPAFAGIQKFAPWERGRLARKVALARCAPSS